MKIVRLTSKNIKRLKAVEIAPDGNVVVVGGRNGQGKTSVLDSIAYALGGKDVICREPIRRGEEHAEVVCDLGELIVRRTFTAGGGGSLTVESKDGARFAKPQGRLDDLIGSLSFDPLAFSRGSAAEQSETLRNLLGLDFTKLDGDRSRVFDERTQLNRDGKALAARHAAMQRWPDAPVAEVSSASILSEIEAVQKVNAANERQRQMVEQKRLGIQVDGNRHGAALKKADDTLKEIAALNQRHAEELREVEHLFDQLQVATDQLKTESAAVSALVDADTSPLKTRLLSTEAINQQVRDNRIAEQVGAELDGKRAESAALTARLDAIDEGKRAAVAAVQFPVTGLGFSEGGVTLAGIPFDQASAAEQLCVSVAIGIALNPKLRVLLIRDASLLDAESLRLVAEMADKHDAQLWLERVEDEGSTVVIEDGSVVGAAQEVAS